jgi:serine protease Do
MMSSMMPSLDQNSLSAGWREVNSPLKSVGLFEHLRYLWLKIMKVPMPTAFAKLAAFSLLCALCGAAEPAKPPSASLDLARQLNQAFIEVAEQVSPAVVVIKVAQKPGELDLDNEDNPLWEMLPPEFRRQLERQREQRDKERNKTDESPGAKEPPVFNGQGSGVVIREEGFILTNRHVVDGADKIKVRFNDGEEFDAEVRGVDSQSDLAVLKINPKGKKLKAARLGNSETTRVGEFAIAIGAPFELDYSVTFGHVSAKGRSRIINDPYMDQDFIQTDANINPGNSGGPLVNIEGEVIGINTLIKGLRTGIGFAIPVNLVREVSDKLITDGKYVRAWLGIAIQALREYSDYRDILTNVSDGVLVKEIHTNTPAAKSELKPSDVITAVDGKMVSTPQQLKNEIRGKKIGDTVVLDVHRSGKNIKVKVKPDAWPDEPTLVAGRRTPSTGEPETSSKFGLKVEAITTEMAEQYGISKSDGVVITEVERGSLAERKGLRPGDVITEVNHKPIASPKQFRDALKSVDPKKGVILNFTSRGTSKFEILKETGD